MFPLHLFSKYSSRTRLGKGIYSEAPLGPKLSDFSATGVVGDSLMPEFERALVARELATEVILFPDGSIDMKMPYMHLVNKSLRFIFRSDQGSGLVTLTGRFCYCQRGTGTILRKQQADAARSGDERVGGQVPLCLVAQSSLCCRMGFLQKSMVRKRRYS